MTPPEVPGPSPTTAALLETREVHYRIHRRLIAHESHHRGPVTLTLRQAGCPLDRKAAFGMGEWGARQA